MLVQQLINGISIGGIYALMATGYALIYSLLGFSNWAHGDVAMTGAYIGVLCMTVVHLPFGFGAVAAIAGAGLISYLIERVAYRPIRKYNSPTMFLMIAAMGMSVSLQNFVLVTVGPKFKTYPRVLPVKSIAIASVHIGVLDVFSLCIALATIVAFALVINRTKFGLAIKACASNMRIASLLGVNINLYISLVFVLAGSLAGLSGILLGMKYTVYPQMGNVALKAFIASVFGGLGSVTGAIFGALILGVLEVLVAGYVSTGLRDLVTFSLLIVVLIIRPNGLMGKLVEEKA